ncbi:glycosyltransferase [Candidatus Woesearchaeota archaeon]|nr:MAG: glycosyltransferase [Candidatus Woesearchaeota archaeon]
MHIVIYSSRGGGPYKIYQLTKTYLEKKGHTVVLYNTFWRSFYSLLFEKKQAVISNIPIPFPLKAKYLLNIQGRYFKERHILRNPLAYLYPLAIPVADDIVVASLFLRKALHLPKAKVIPNIIEPVQKEVAKKKRRTFLSLITINNFAFKEKALGVFKILEMLASLKADYVLHYDVYGSGKYLAEVRQKAALLKFPQNIQVFFHGPTNKVMDVLRASDIFLYWSDLDNMPQVILEAMMSELPVISNDVGAVKEVISDKKNGYICDEHTYLPTLLSLCADKDKRIKVGKEARSSVIKNFSPEKIMPLWEKLLRS